MVRLDLDGTRVLPAGDGSGRAEASIQRVGLQIHYPVLTGLAGMAVRTFSISAGLVASIVTPGRTAVDDITAHTTTATCSDRHA